VDTATLTVVPLSIARAGVRVTGKSRVETVDGGLEMYRTRTYVEITWNSEIVPNIISDTMDNILICFTVYCTGITWYFKTEGSMAEYLII
jgi:hypothetical protein